MPVNKPSGDDGVSLIELMIVIILLAIISGIVSTAMIGAMRGTRQHQNRSYAVSSLQTQLERVARDIRVADPVRAASATSVTFDLYKGATCVRRTWSVVNGALTVASTTYAAWSSCAAYPATATPTSSSTTTAIAALGNGATPVFTFADGIGAPLPSTPTLSSIGSIAVTLVQSVPEGRVGPTFSTSVGVKNATIR